MFAIAFQYDTIAPHICLTEFGWVAWHSFCNAMSDPAKMVRVRYQHWDGKKLHMSEYSRGQDEKTGKGYYVRGDNIIIDL